MFCEIAVLVVVGLHSFPNHVCAVPSMNPSEYMLALWRLISQWFGCKGTDAESRRLIYDSAGNLTVMLAYCSIFINPLIYLLHYDVVKSSLINWARNAAAKLRNQQPSDTE